MSLDIGTLVGFVDLDTSGVRKGAAETRTQVNRLGNDIDSVGSRTASRFGSTMGLALKRVGLGMAGLGIAGGVMGLKTAASMENADIAFTTMLGSATKAHTFLKKLADFAAATPFEFPELQTAASSLISAGVNAAPAMVSTGSTMNTSESAAAAMMLNGFDVADTRPAVDATRV